MTESSRLSGLALAGSVLAALWLSCAGEPPAKPSLVRLGDLLPQRPDERWTLAHDLTLDSSPRRVPAAFEAARVTALEISAAGDAASLEVNWLLDGEDQLDERRAGSIHLDKDGEEHRYTLELEGLAAWSGRIAALELAASGGTLAIRDLTAVAPGSYYREIELGRLNLPAIAGRERLEIPLPPQAGRATFEARVGVNPVLEGTGVTATFRVRVEGGPGVAAPGPEVTISPSGRWELVSGPVDASSGGVLVLESELRRGGERLAPELGFWGGPVLIAGPRPGLNLLVIVVDTLRADVIGAYGDDSGLTPNIDELARRSIRFTDLVAPSPWTLPSLASLMTGLQPQTHGAGSRHLSGERSKKVVFARLDSELTTLSQVLSRAGFYTAGFVNSPFLEPAFGLTRHWDEYRTFDSETRADAVADRAVEALERMGERRFFFFIHVLDPHTPYEPSETDCREIARRLTPESPKSWPCRVVRSRHGDTVPREQRSWAEALYRAEVAHVDRQIGRLTATLDALGLSKNTIVLFLADHGEDFWNHQEQKQRFGYFATSDHGNSFYQELLHVPAILSVPGREPRAVDAPAEIVDLFPTVLGYLGVDPPPNQGRDLGPLIDGRPPEPVSSERLRLAGFLLYGSPRWAARRGPWKLVVRPGRQPLVELYNLSEDPGETRDRSSEKREVVVSILRQAEAEFRARRELRQKLEGNAGQEAAQLDDDQLATLRALGYLE